MSDHKSVVDIGCFEIQIPSEGFLAGLFISSQASLAKLADWPRGYIISDVQGF